MVSNELKIPIIRSLKALEVLKSKLTNYIDFSVLDIIKDLNSNLSKRIEMIDGLLNYALLGDKKEVSWVSMQKEVEKLILDFKKEFDRRNTVITFDTLPGLRASTFEIHLLLKNMLFWFVKKTPENKSPRIHINVIEEIDSWKIGFESISIQVNQSDFDPFITKLSNSPEHLIYFSDIVQMQKILNSIDGIFITELMERQGGVIWIIFKKNEVPISKMF